MHLHESCRRDTSQEGAFQLFGDLVSTHEGMCHEIFNFESLSRVDGQDAFYEVFGIVRHHNVAMLEAFKFILACPYPQIGLLQGFGLERRHTEEQGESASQKQYMSTPVDHASTSNPYSLFSMISGAM